MGVYILSPISHQLFPQTMYQAHRSHLFFAFLATMSILSIHGYHPAVAISKPSTEIAANQIYIRANPAVVTIRANNRYGSGFIVSGDGYVVTNAHVVKNEPAVVTLIMADGKTEIPADVVGFGTQGLDLALLKINRRSKLPTLPLGRSRSIKVGDTVYAIGTPLDEDNQNSFTSGMVSAIRSKGSRIQHNAPINSGNSGGPLLNVQGEVIGVNQSGMVGRVICADGRVCGISTGNVGVNFAIGVDVLRQFLSDARQGKISPIATF
jgi:serine protease Do